jgi:ribosomal subunit interface protein
MKITIKSTVDLTPALEAYIEKKFAPLEKFLKHFEENGEIEVRLEIGRTSNHHNKGEVFAAIVDVRLPKKILRAEEYAEDMRTAIDQAKDTLRMEIEKHKAKLKPQRGRES